MAHGGDVQDDVPPAGGVSRTMTQPLSRSVPFSSFSIAIGVAILLCGSCVTVTHERLGGAEFSARPEGHPILVFETIEDVKRPYVKVALINGATGSKLANAMASVKARARSLGADAIVVYQIGLHRGSSAAMGSAGGRPVFVGGASYQESASVLAIRFEEDPTDAAK